MSDSGWLGQLQLDFETARGGTRLARSSHVGPLRVQRVLYPEGPGCPHLYLLHPPGGVVGGDRLETRINLGTSSSALLTTPAAQKLYRSGGRTAEISSDIAIGEGARLEWLPSETLAFSGACARLSTRVTLQAGAAFLGWDVAGFGMPARSEPFTNGRVLSRFELFRGPRPLLIEALDLEPAVEPLDTPFGLRGYPVVATLYAVPAGESVPESLVDRVREVTREQGRGVFSVSSLDELLVVRALAPNVEVVRGVLVKIWQLLRPLILEREAVLPRVWAT